MPIGESDNPALDVAAARRTWLIIVLAMAASVVIYAVPCVFMMQSRTASGSSLPTMRPMMYGFAVISLVAAVGWMQWKTSGRIGDAPTIAGRSSTATLMEPGDFQTQSITSIALADACSIYGLVLFFLGAPITEFAVFAAGALLVILLYILPRGLKFWAAWENAEKQSGQNSPFSS